LEVITVSDVVFRRVNGRIVPIRKKEEDKAKKYAPGAAAAGGGALAVKASLPRVTGRTTYYHGTTSESAERIMKKGIRPGASAGIADGLDKKLKAGKYTYVTRKKSQAKSYGRQAVGLEQYVNDVQSMQKKNAADATFSGIMERMGKKVKVSSRAELTREYMQSPERSFQLAFGKNGKVVKISMPHEFEKKHRVMNPELRGTKNGREYFKKLFTDPHVGPKFEAMDLKPDSPIGRVAGPMMYRTLNTPTFDRDIPTDFIKGSAGYKRHSMTELTRYIKGNKGRFATGVALAGAGAAAMAWGANDLYRKARD
jgi:hypothetical protein